MKKLIGLFASVTLLGSGMAFAQSQMDTSQSQQKQGQSGSMQQGSDIGGSGTQSGQMGQSGQINPLSGNQLTGRVVKSEKKMVWIEHAGAIVPLKIDKNTQFTDPSLKRAQDLKEGDEIRASFEVRKTDNVATSIGKAAGTGGSGTEVMSPDSSINQPSTLPSKKGSDLGSPDINSGTGGSSSVGKDSSDVNQNKSTSGNY